MQAVETELPTGELEFVGHSKQLNTVPGAVYVPAMQSQFDVVAPEIVEYVLPTQRAQGAEPGELLYVPAVQIVQNPPLRPLDPMLHVQSLGALLPDGDDDREGQLEHVLDVVAPEVVEYVPPTQRAQEAEPGEILYVPAVQIIQDLPSGPLDPLLHVHSLRA